MPTKETIRACELENGDVVVESVIEGPTLGVLVPTTQWCRVLGEPGVNRLQRGQRIAHALAACEGQIWQG